MPIFHCKDKYFNYVPCCFQTFLKLTNQKTNQEIIFVADAASNKFDLVRLYMLKQNIFLRL